MIRRMIEGGSNRIKASDWNKIAEAVERAQNPLAGGAGKPMKGNCWLWYQTLGWEPPVIPAFSLVKIYQPIIPPTLDNLSTLYEPVFIINNQTSDYANDSYDKYIRYKYPNSASYRYAVTLSDVSSPGDVCRGVIGGIVPIVTTIHDANHKYIRPFYGSDRLRTESHHEGFPIIWKESGVGGNKICFISLNHDHVTYENPYRGYFSLQVEYKKVVDVPADPDANPPVEEQSHIGVFVKVDSGRCIVNNQLFSVSEKTFDEEITPTNSEIEVRLRYDDASGKPVIEKGTVQYAYSATEPAVYIGYVSIYDGIKQFFHGTPHLFRLERRFCSVLDKYIYCINP